MVAPAKRAHGRIAKYVHTKRNLHVCVWCSGDHGSSGCTTESDIKSFFGKDPDVLVLLQLFKTACADSGLYDLDKYKQVVERKIRLQPKRYR